MSRQRNRRLSATVVQEILALYADPDNTVEGIEAAYSIPPGVFYRVLHKHGIPLRSKGSAPMPTTPPNGRPSTAVTVDANDVVVAAQREDHSMPQWEITVQRLLRVRATSIEEAIHRAKTDPDVRLVVAARLIEGA